MKFHINDKNEVKRCRAKKRCKFASSENGGEHFSTVREAEDALKKMQKTKPRTEKGFAPIRSQVSTALKKYTGVKTLPTVYTKNEMIEKWFNGNAKRMSDFMSVSNDLSIDDDQKEHIVSLISKGVKVSPVSSAIKKESTDWGSNTESHLDLIDEEDDKIALDMILSGREKIFAA